MNEDIRIIRLQLAKAEALRFIEKADKAIEDLGKNHYHSSKPFAAAKRAAIDTASAMHDINKSRF